MDPLTERLTYDLMFEHLQGLPMMIVAHRLSTYGDATGSASWTAEG